MDVAANELEPLNNPTTTLEETEELGRNYKKSTELIVVTDAIHMPQAT